MQDQTILCVATRVWDSLWRNTQQIMSRVAQQNRVFFFEPGRNPDRAHGREMWRNRSNFLKFESRTIHDNLVVIPTPPALPYMRQQLPPAALKLWLPLVARFNAQLLTRHIRWAMGEFEIQSPILWLYEPRHVHLAGKFGEKLICYYNYDEMADFAGNERIRDLLNAYDDRLVRRADIVFASSRGQTERRRQINPNTHFVPNGVDFELFNQALDPQTEVAPDIAQLKRPIIGFTGWLGYQLDVDLLLRVAETFDDCTVALVGPDQLPNDERSARLRAMPNVAFLGKKALTELPAYLKAFDVALIPYILHGHTQTVYPLKLHEYLAAGRSIVATALPELAPYEHIIRIGDSHTAFIDAVRSALQQAPSDVLTARVAMAQQNTWDQRVIQVYRALEPFFADAKGEYREDRRNRLDTLQST